MTIGKEPPIWKLQIVLLCGAIIFTGRIFFISRISTFDTQVKEILRFKEGLMAAIGNRSLTGFSVYQFTLNLTVYGTVPLTMIYLNRRLNAPSNIIVIISAMTLVGMLLGYFSVGRIIKRWGIKTALLVFHLSYAIVSLILFFISTGTATLCLM